MLHDVGNNRDCDVDHRNNTNSHYLVPFASYLTLNNIVTLKSGLEVTQDH